MRILSMRNLSLKATTRWNPDGCIAIASASSLKHFKLSDVLSMTFQIRTLLSMPHVTIMGLRMHVSRPVMHAETCDGKDADDADKEDEDEAEADR
jgi:hypothetical protein